MICVKNKKNWFWNSVRGLCICLVLLIHVTVPINEDGIILPEWYVLRKLTAFPVAMFFFMAGYFVHIDKIFERKYLWLKIKRVLFPYIIISVLHIILNSLLGNVASWKGILANLVLGTAEIHLYFLLYLAQMLVLLPVWKCCLDKPVLRGLLLWGSLVLSAAVGYARLTSDQIPLAMNIICLQFLFYYIFGLYMRGATEGRYRAPMYQLSLRMKNWEIALMLTVSLVLSCVDGKLLYSVPNYSQITLGNYLYSSVVIMALMTAARQCRQSAMPGWLKLLTWLGENSFWIYLIHMLYMRPMIRWLDSFALGYPAEQIILFVAALLLCIVSAMLKNTLLDWINDKRRLITHDK